MDMGRLLENARLPSPAPVVLKLYEVLEQGGAEDIARVLEADPGLAARLLRLANSAFYAPPQVASVQEAVVRAGTLDVAALVLAIEVMRIFRGVPEARFSLRSFWEHSLWTACYSQTLGSAGTQRQAAPLWLCGLLHDIGRLLLARQAPEEYGALLEAVEAGQPLLTTERTLLGATHAAVGAQLLSKWRLPAVLVACAARHHDEYASLDAPWSIVAAANDLANNEGEAIDLPELTAEKAEEVKTEARARYAGFRQLFSEYLR